MFRRPGRPGRRVISEPFGVNWSPGMNILAGIFFAAFAICGFGRLFAGLKSGEMWLKLYLPVASRSDRPLLYWTYSVLLGIASVALGCFSVLCFGVG